MLLLQMTLQESNIYIIVSTICMSTMLLVFKSFAAAYDVMEFMDLNLQCNDCRKLLQKT